MCLGLTANDQIQDRECMHAIGRPVVNFQKRKKEVIFDRSKVRPMCVAYPYAPRFPRTDEADLKDQGQVDTNKTTFML